MLRDAGSGEGGPQGLPPHSAQDNGGETTSVDPQALGKGRFWGVDGVGAQGWGTHSLPELSRGDGRRSIPDSSAEGSAGHL